MNQSSLKIKQYVLSPAAGKRLIAKSLLLIPDILEALENRTVVVVAGTTNGYVAEEFLTKLGQLEGFTRDRFYRGITLSHNYKKVSDKEGSREECKFLGDVVIVNGTWAKGMTIFDIADELKIGDIIFKGANAVNLEMNQAAVVIGNPSGGTISPILECNIGRRVELYLPVGLEKRISGNISEIAAKLNSVDATGTRYMPVSGKIVTELQAIKFLAGAEAELVACSGVCGAEGSYRLAVTGAINQLEKMDEVYEEVKGEESLFY